ncbi:scavenger receptor cysteine-rich type 1 protein M130 [Haplochromis burtoni]|uniref:scavenger receptor cysteine-rich type 1 protein M130 n=1 Tax=Haplochromis burtoni TaxID=8153 RepID=UPI001C2D3B74|nr:scavenger receptor cysteine-rich type 1 protein M130 [Haplochromis burtoni]
MDHLLLLLLLWSSGISERNQSSAEPDEVRLVGKASHCGGTLEMKHVRKWRPVDFYNWTLKKAAVVCEHLDCGSAVSVQERKSPRRFVWSIRPDCFQSGSKLGDCLRLLPSTTILNLTCLDSVRLLNGSSLCSGGLQVKSSQRWSSVCEADFDLQDAEVVCRELGCGPPSLLQGALYGEAEAPVWSREFQCGGHESALLDCRSSGSARSSCSPGKAAGLTCSGRRGAAAWAQTHFVLSLMTLCFLSEPVRLVGGASRCAGTLEVKHLGEWRPVDDNGWTMKPAAVVCEHLDCGSAVSVGKKMSTYRFVLKINPDCFKLRSSLRECVEPSYSSSVLSVTCSDLLAQPSIIVPASMDGVSEAQQQGLRVSRGSSLTISCSIQPQFPGGSFQLTFTSSNTAYNYTQPAVNHSAHFLFPVTEPAHQGNYSCFYRVYVFSHNFSSESRQLSVTVSGHPDPTGFIIRALVLPLILLLENVVLYFYCKASRGQRLGRPENNKLVNFGVGAAEEGPAEEEGAHLISR